MAEAVAIVGLVASIASLVDLTIKVVSRLREFTSKSTEVPESFRSLSTRLPLLTATLQHIQSQIKDSGLPDDAIKALKAVVDDTTKQISDIQISLSKVLPLDGASKLERALKALKSLAKEDKVERALEKIYRNNEILVLYQTTRHVDTGDRILEALSKLNIAPPIRPCPSLTIPFSRDPDFVNRGAILEQLHQKCSLPASRTALVGLGGVGKSQLAIEFGYRIREQSPETWVLWVHAGSIARLEQNFRDIADFVEIPRRQDPKANIFQLVHDWLRDEKNRRWLLILDNLDNLDNSDLLSEVEDTGQRGQGSGLNGERRRPITAYLPQSQNGSVLVTSRSKDVALKLVEKRDIVAVLPMAPVHALSLFEKKLGPLEQGSYTMDLVAALEYMPLAIVQAATYISQRAPRYSVQRYLEDYQKSDRKKTSLLDYEGGQLRRDWQAQNSIIITWQVSFEYIHRNWPSAADLLSLMSFFDRQGIPEALVRGRDGIRNNQTSHEERDKYDRGREVEDGEDNQNLSEDDISENSGDDTFEDDVQTLKNYSLLSVSPDRTFEMHALVQLATRKWLEANGKLEKWKQYYIKNLSAQFPSGRYENWKSCQALFPHVRSATTQRPKVEESLKEWALLLHNAAWYSWARGIIDEAIDLSEIAMNVRKKILGQEHKDTLNSMAIVGLAYSSAGRLKDAEKLQLLEREASQRTLGEEYPDTLKCTNNLAITYLRQGRWKEAEQLQIQLLEMIKKVLGEEHPDTLMTINNVATTYSKQGRLKEAEELEAYLLEIRKKILGNEHPDTLMTINNVATTYSKQGRLKEAEELEVYVLETSKRVLGEEHPNTLACMAGVAVIFKSQTRHEDAISLLENCIKLQIRILGPEHPDTEASCQHLHMWKSEADKT